MINLENRQSKLRKLILIALFAIIGVVIAQVDGPIAALTGFYGSGLIVLPLLVGSFYIFIMLYFNERWAFAETMLIGSILALPTPTAGPPMYLIKVPILIAQGLFGDVVFTFLKTRLNPLPTSVITGLLYWVFVVVCLIPKYLPLYGPGIVNLYITFILPITLVTGPVSGWLGLKLYERVKGTGI